MLSEPWRDLPPVQAPCFTWPCFTFSVQASSGLRVSSSPKCLPRGRSLFLLSCSLATLVPPLSADRQTESKHLQELSQWFPTALEGTDGASL